MEIEKGKLVRWIDDKGFGFIKPDAGGSDIFIHISALKSMSRPPVVGDIIYYESNLDDKGKLRAINAKIEGVATPI
jgi:cold shock CspA family protein